MDCFNLTDDLERELARELGLLEVDNSNSMSTELFSKVVDKEHSAYVTIEYDEYYSDDEISNDDLDINDEDVDLVMYHKQYYVPEPKMLADGPPKRNAGRPPKFPKVELPPGPGIMDEPRSNVNIMEFETLTIKELKQFLTIVSSFKCIEMRIEFRRYDIRFTVPFTDGSITHFMHISAERTYAYYCEQPFTIYVSVPEIKRAFIRLNEKTDRAYIEQNRELINSSIKIGLRRGVSDTIDTTFINVCNTAPEMSFDRHEIAFVNYPLKIEMRATELKSIVKSESNKSAICYFTKMLEHDFVTICIKSDGNPDRESRILPCANAVITSNTTEKIIAAHISLVALTKSVMHPPTEIIAIHIPSNHNMPIICEYRNTKMFMHIYVYKDSI